MKKLKIDWYYAKLFLLMIIVIFGAYGAGEAKAEADSCSGVIRQANSIVLECNEKIRECNNIPQEFNLSRFNVTWNVTT